MHTIIVQFGTHCGLIFTVDAHNSYRKIGYLMWNGFLLHIHLMCSRFVGLETKKLYFEWLNVGFNLFHCRLGRIHGIFGRLNHLLMDSFILSTSQQVVSQCPWPVLDHAGEWKSSVVAPIPAALRLPLAFVDGYIPVHVRQLNFVRTKLLCSQRVARKHFFSECSQYVTGGVKYIFGILEFNFLFLYAYLSFLVLLYSSLE